MHSRPVGLKFRPAKLLLRAIKRDGKELESRSNRRLTCDCTIALERISLVSARGFDLLSVRTQATTCSFTTIAVPVARVSSAGGINNLGQIVGDYGDRFGELHTISIGRRR